MKEEINWYHKLFIVQHTVFQSRVYMVQSLKKKSGYGGGYVGGGEHNVWYTVMQYCWG